MVRSYGGREAITRFRQEHRVRIGDERILGDSDFVERALREDEIAMESRSRMVRQGWDLDRLISKACALYDVSEAALMKKSRANDISKAKAMICYCGRVKMGLTAQEIAHRLDISQPAVSKWIVKGREQADNSWMLLGFDE